jgi:hypothetical protein
MLFPYNAGTMHACQHVVGSRDRDQVLEHDLGYKGLYHQASNGHEGTQPIYDVVVATL